MNIQPAHQAPRNGMDYTQADLSGHLGPVKSNGQLLITFEYGRVQVKSRLPGQKNRLETRLFVRLKPMGERSTEAIETVSEEEAMRQWPAEFSHFKTYQSVPTRGTPLSELPGMSQSMIGLCLINGLRSAEDLASISEDVASQAGLDVSSAHRLAKVWIARRDGNAKIIDNSDETARLIEMNRILSEKLQAMEVSMRAMEMVSQQRASAAQVPPEYTGDMSGAPQIHDARGSFPAELPDMPFGGDVSDGNGDLGGADPDPLRG